MILLVGILLFGGSIALGLILSFCFFLFQVNNVSSYKKKKRDWNIWNNGWIFKTKPPTHGIRTCSSLKGSFGCSFLKATSKSLSMPWLRWLMDGWWAGATIPVPFWCCASVLKTRFLQQEKHIVRFQKTFTPPAAVKIFDPQKWMIWRLGVCTR